MCAGSNRDRKKGRRRIEKEGRLGGWSEPTTEQEVKIQKEKQSEWKSDSEEAAGNAAPRAASVWKIQNLTASRRRTRRDLARVESCPVQLTGRDVLCLSTTLSLPTPFLVLSAFRSPSSSSFRAGFTERGSFRHRCPNLLSHRVKIRWKIRKRVVLVLISLCQSYVKEWEVRGGTLRGVYLSILLIYAW